MLNFLNNLLGGLKCFAMTAGKKPEMPKDAATSGAYRLHLLTAGKKPEMPKDAATSGAYRLQHVLHRRW